MTELPYHPIAEAFNLPLIEGAEFDAFVEDIRANKQCEAITVYQNKVLDGRNRYRACTKLGVEPRLTQFLGDDNAARAFVISKNVRRRHLTAEQRQSLLIAYIAGAPENSDRQLGAAIGVDHKTIASARAKGEDVGKIPHVAKRKDKKGRKQPAKKPIKAKKPAKAKKPIKILNVATGELREATEEDIAAARATSKAAKAKAKETEPRAADAATNGASIIADAATNAASEGNDVDPVAAAEKRKAEHAELDAEPTKTEQSATEAESKRGRERRSAPPPLAEMIERAEVTIGEAWLGAVVQAHGADGGRRFLDAIEALIPRLRKQIDDDESESAAAQNEKKAARTEEHADAAA
jgi:hypothetical protein